MMGKPILFTPENAQKCHEGTKTQTRRTTGLQQFNEQPSRWRLEGNQFAFDGGFEYVPVPSCPYGQVGDRLWVREPFAWPGEEVLLYRGCPANSELVKKWEQDKNCPQVKWTPSIHMPKWACRTWLEITEIRVQRLQEISEEDCLAEGVEYFYAGLFRDYLQSGDVGIESAVGSYRSLWESINGPGSWEANPWVWAITFKKVQP